MSKSGRLDIPKANDDSNSGVLSIKAMLQAVVALKMVERWNQGVSCTWAQVDLISADTVMAGLTVHGSCPSFPWPFRPRDDFAMRDLKAVSMDYLNGKDTGVCCDGRCCNVCKLCGLQFG